jgi:beta-lactamase class A
MAAVALQPAMAGAPVAAPAWHMPTWRLTLRPWMRHAALYALVAVMVVSSAFGVRQFVISRALASAKTADVPAPAAQKPAAAGVVTSNQLQQILNQFTASNPGNWGIVVTDLANGATASTNAAQQMESASLYKLFVADHIYQQIDLGQLGYTDDAGGGSGRDVQDCLTIMINISDNTCGRALGTILGWGGQNQSLMAEGYRQTDLATPQQTSAQDVALLFTKLYNGTLVSARSSQAFLGLLKDQQINNRLPQGLPGGTVIAHKTGDLDNFVHDTGIVYGPKANYVVVVMSGPWNDPTVAPGMFANLSQQLWNYIEQQ